MSKHSVKIDEEMFDRLINVIQCTDHSEDIDVVLKNEYEDTLYYEGGLTIGVSHYDTKTGKRIYCEFTISQLVREQRFRLIDELAGVWIREIETIIEDAKRNVG